MLFRLVRPLRRPGSSNPYFAQRIPADLRTRAIGVSLAIPLGQSILSLTITAKTESIRFSLRSRDPAEVKIRQATAAAYLETVWLALRQSGAVALTYKQATALAGELYWAWAKGEGREKTLAVEWDGEKMVPATVTPADEQAHFDGGLAYFAKLAASEKPEDLEKPLGKLIDRLLLAKGIARLDAESRPLLLEAFRLALVDAFTARQRNAGGDFAADPKAERFPEWIAPNAPEPKPAAAVPAKVSLKGIVEDWWREAKATGRKPSTYESYSNSMALFVAFVKHDDASRITPENVIGFKNHRLASNSPRTGKPISAKTVKDSDLAGLKTVFGWAVSNRKMAVNPAEGVTVKLGKPQKLRSSGFTEEEAQALLTAASRHKGEREEPRTRAAKQWVPWLCAYTGARVGELAQLRKQDLRQVEEHWVITITPEAGTVKTNEAREVVLHEQLVERGFCAFATKAAAGHLFLKPGDGGDVRGPLQGLKNRLAEFARATVTDPNVAPNHGWRHRFKTIGREAGIDPGVLDAIQGHAPGSVSDRYGEVTLKTMAAAIAKLPRISVA
jgi:integrase